MEVRTGGIPGTRGALNAAGSPDDFAGLHHVSGLPARPGEVGEDGLALPVRTRLGDFDVLPVGRGIRDDREDAVERGEDFRPDDRPVVDAVMPLEAELRVEMLPSDHEVVSELLRHPLGGFEYRAESHLPKR